MLQYGKIQTETQHKTWVNFYSTSRILLNDFFQLDNSSFTNLNVITNLLVIRQTTDNEKVAVKLRPKISVFKSYTSNLLGWDLFSEEL